jgi:hypothetical protein
MTQSKEFDFIGDLLVRSKDAALPRSYREKYGASEPTFASASGIAFLHEMLRLLKTIHSGISALQRQHSLANIFSKEVRQNSPTRKLASSIIALGKDDAEQAAKIISSDFDAINSLSIVAMCTVYEVATEDTMKTLLRFSPGLIQKVQSLGVNTDKLPNDRDLSYSEATLGLKRLKDWCRKKNKEIPEGDILMFNCLGVAIDPSNDTKSHIRELIYVRNCIVHRGKRADAKCIDEAPRLGLVDGDMFSVSRGDMGIYVNSLLALLVEIFERINNASLINATKAQVDPT